MDELDVFIALSGLAATILVAIYTVKSYHRVMPEEEILPWSPWY